MEAEHLHLLACFFRRPTLVGHAIRGDHHTGPVIAIATMYEDLLLRVFAQKHEKLRNNFVLGKIAMPGYRNILHAESGYLFPFFVLASKAEIYYKLHTHRFQLLKAV